MPIHVLAGEVPEHVSEVGGASMATTAVYGDRASLMVATRPAGYHSDPHTHECEQLNWLRAGELWIFVEDRAFRMRPGDFLRVPAGAVHWAWNRSDGPCTLVEVHSPGMQADPSVSAFAVGLFDEDETPAPTGSPVNRFVPDDAGFDRRIAEGRAT